jgi:hypothetical protein
MAVGIAPPAPDVDLAEDIPFVVFDVGCTRAAAARAARDLVFFTSLRFLVNGCTPSSNGDMASDALVVLVILRPQVQHEDGQVILMLSAGEMDSNNLFVLTGFRRFNYPPIIL